MHVEFDIPALSKWWLPLAVGYVAMLLLMRWHAPRHAGFRERLVVWLFWPILSVLFCLLIPVYWFVWLLLPPKQPKE